MSGDANLMKKRVHVSECTDADVLVEDITNRYGAFILPSGYYYKTNISFKNLLNLALNLYLLPAGMK
jgi:hypothetical protein